MSSQTIDVFIDIVCPWCFIGAERLESVLRSEPVQPAVSYHPFMLDPGTPPEGFDVQEHLRKKYGGDPLQMFATVEAAAKASGIPLDLRRQPKSYPTAAAHTLVRHAEAKGTQRALVLSLLRGYFLDAQNISDPSSLAVLAAPHGFSADEVVALVGDGAELARTRSDAQEAAMGGVRGVPLFIFDGRRAFSGAQPEDVLRSALRGA